MRTTTINPEIAALWLEHLRQPELADCHGDAADPVRCEQLALASNSQWVRGYWLGRAAALRDLQPWSALLRNG